jgi:hypothetical protein
MTNLPFDAPEPYQSAARLHGPVRRGIQRRNCAAAAKASSQSRPRRQARQARTAQHVRKHERNRLSRRNVCASICQKRITLIGKPSFGRTRAR